MTYELDAVSSYLNQINSYPLLTESEVKKLGRIIKKSDKNSERYKSAVDELTVRNLRLVIRIAKKYSHLGIPLMDTIGYGNMGLYHAAKIFDVDRDCKFSTLAYSWITQAIIRPIPEEFTVRIPIHAVEKMYRLNKSIDELAQTLGRYPTWNDIIKSTQLPKEYFFAFRNFYLSNLLSLNKRYTDNDGEDCNSLLDIVSDDKHEEPHEPLQRTDLYERIKDILNTLKPRDNDILQRRFGFNGYVVHTLEEIGEIYSLTRERIRQIEAKCLRKLRGRKEVRQLYASYSGKTISPNGRLDVSNPMQRQYPPVSHHQQ
jgi:RNA polymerase sigma factor (sigma-70 family)